MSLSHLPYGTVSFGKPSTSHALLSHPLARGHVLALSGCPKAVSIIVPVANVYDVNDLVSKNKNLLPITLNEANIFMPYPETDVIQNPYFNQPAQSYDFGE